MHFLKLRFLTPFSLVFLRFAGSVFRSLSMSEALMVSNSTTGTFFGTSGTIPPFGKPFSFFSIYFTLFRFIFASVYAIIFLNFSKNFSSARLLRIFSCIHRMKNSCKQSKQTISEYLYAKNGSSRHERRGGQFRCRPSFKTTRL